MREKLALLLLAAVGAGVISRQCSGVPVPAVGAAERAVAAPPDGSAPEAVRRGGVVSRPLSPPSARRTALPAERPAPTRPTSSPPQPRRTPAPEDVLDLDALFRDLRDDDDPLNAREAARALTRLLDDPGWGPAVVAGAERRLSSDDRQQRLLVTQLLISHALETGSRHLEVLDRALEWVGGAPYQFPSWLQPSTDDARRLCARELEQVESRLVAMLLDPSDPGHAGAVEILAAERHRPTLDVYAPELVGQLADNEVEGDALLAAWLLKRLGDDALPHLAGPFVDRQQADLASMIRREIARPGSSRPDRPRYDLSRRAPDGPVSRWCPDGWLAWYER